VPKNPIIYLKNLIPMSLLQFIKDISIVYTAFHTNYAADRLHDINEKLDDMSLDMLSSLSESNLRLDEINHSIRSFEKQTLAEIVRLKKSVEKGFSDISLELAVQSDLFRSIDKVLKDKVAVEAKEYMRFGIKALQNKWYNDAKADFEKSIELNRYDYKVYYLIAKCYEGLENGEMQEEYLEKAFHYAKNDPKFQQYIGLDMVGILMKRGDMANAKEAAKTIMALMPEDKRNASPLLLCQLRIDVKANNITDETISVVNRLVDSNDYRYQIKMIRIVTALTEDIEGDYKTKIDNVLNLKKAALSKTCAMLLQNSLNNIKDLFVNYLRSYKEVVDLDTQLKILNAQGKKSRMFLKESHDINISTVDDFNKYYYLLCESMNLERNMMNVMHYRMGSMLDILKEVKNAPEILYDLDIDGDKTIWQVTDRENTIALSYNSVVITENAFSEFQKKTIRRYPLESLGKLKFEKSVETDAFDDFLNTYEINDEFDINYYRDLFAQKGFEPKKSFYVIRDDSMGLDILTGFQYNFSTTINQDLTDTYQFRVNDAGQEVFNEMSNFESVETIMDKAQRLNDAYQTMRQVDIISKSYNNIVLLLDEDGGVMQPADDNDNIEFID